MNYWYRVEQFEKKLILKSLESCRWNKSECARMLQIPRRTLDWKIQTLGISKPVNGVSYAEI